MNKKLCACLCAAATCALCATSCKSGESSSAYGKNIYAMGAFATMVSARSKSDNAKSSDFSTVFSAAAREVEEAILAVENSISVTVESSYISAFNNAPADTEVEMDKTAYDILSLAKSVYASTGGYYNPAVYYSVDLYGFGARAYGISAPYDRAKVNGAYPLPSAEYVSVFQTLSTHFAEVTLAERNGAYYAYKPAYTVTVEGVEYSLKLDLGGIGKGVCADIAAEIYDKYSMEYGYFNFASSSIAFKKYNGEEDGCYTLSIRDPRGEAGEAYCSVKVKDCSLSTSGDHEQYYVLDGARYCHIIDPTTGSPIQTDIASVTVIGGEAAEDDALTTALAAMGKQKAVEYVNNNLTDKTVIILYIGESGGEVITNAPEKLTLKTEKYKIANTAENGKIILN